VTSGQVNTNRALLATCVAAAARAAEIIRAGAANRLAIRWEVKSPTDFVSDIDRGAELSPAMDDRSGLVFVADPLDGTTNFLHGFPWYAVSIAALIDGEHAAGVVLNAANGELFTATAGGGARLNGQPISVSPITEPMRALIGTGIPFKGTQGADEYLRILPRVMMETAGIRRPGAAALDLADVACGRFEGFFELKLAPWDIAAGILLVREAGGRITDLTGAPAPVDHTGIVAGNPAIHPWLLERVMSA
jgi:myo-inositol-1(or 4)-monophosphatase